MTMDPLLTDDLATLLRQFPNDALRDLVGVLKEFKSWSPFPANRAYDAHALPPSADFTPHADAIAAEILWWGSHDVHRPFGDAPDWVGILRDTAKQTGVPNAERPEGAPAWRLEDAMFRKALSAWEQMPPDEREAIMTKAGMDLSAARGAAAGVATIAARGAVRAGAEQLIRFLGARFASSAVPFIGPFLVAATTAWSAYDLAGPGYRVLRPAALLIAFHRRRLRERRLISAFGE